MPNNRRDAALSEVRDRDMRTVVAEALSRGWHLERSGSGHLFLRWDATAEGVWLSASLRASRARGRRNLMASIARIERGERGDDVEEQDA